MHDGKYSWFQIVYVYVDVRVSVCAGVCVVCNRGGEGERKWWRLALCLVGSEG